MLSSQEQRIWDDVLRFWAEEAEEPPLATRSAGGSSSDEAELPIAVVAGTWITITLILFGVMSAALAVGLMTALGWALWQYWPRPGPQPHAAQDDQQGMVVTRTPDCHRRGRRAG